MAMQTIPMMPNPLSADDARLLSQSHIKKHQVAIVLLHWFNAIVWLIELATGSALIVAPGYRFMPLWYVRLMDDFVGGHANLLRAHIVVGVTWTIVFLVYAVFGWRHYLHSEVLKKEVGIDRDDVQWLRIRLLRLLNRSRETLPPQGVYNAGQKLYALMVYTMLPLIMITGWIMAFHLIGTAMIQWAMLLHFVTVGMVVSGLLVHIYMGAVFPEERPAFYSMITGTVDELYAYKHHFKWWKEVKQQQAEWQARMTNKPDSNENPPESQAKAALDAGD
jgi:formate dehydrogenase subunit gamma